MTMQEPGNQFDDRDEALEAPAGLVSALRQLPCEKLFVPPTTDEAILRTAQAHLRPSLKSSRRRKEALALDGRGSESREYWSLLTSAATTVSRIFKPAFSLGGKLRFAAWLAGAGAAAVVLLLALYLPKASTKFAREDLNHDGSVDILDAFVLAKRVEASVPADAGIDLNGDGKVDQRDVAALAAQAVSLGKGGHS